MNKVAVSLSIGVMPLEPQVKSILATLNESGVDGFIILSGHQILDPAGSDAALKVAKLFPNKVFTALANEGTWTVGYLLGIKRAVELGANYVISMDADGSHDPRELKKFIEKLKQHPVVLGSRFISGGVNKYPLQRRLISVVGSWLTTIFLTKYRLTDFTSGYEGLRREVVLKVFEDNPMDKWVSTTIGPYHLQNTELRLAVIDSGYDILEIPIVYGITRKGKTFGVMFLFKVIQGFLLLLLNRMKK